MTTAVRADKVTTDRDHTVDFTKFRTYMWINDPDVNSPFMKQRIRAAVDQHLRFRGLREVNDGADLAVGANLATQERHTWETYYSGDAGWGWGWGGGGWSTTEERTYEVGTLTVDLFDACTKQLVWQGVGTDDIPDKPAKWTKDANKQIEKMFRYYPFGEH
jgi:hypothetical protein